VVKIFTEAGSVYDIDDSGICRKYRDGKLIDSFKAFFIRSVPDSVAEFKDIFELPEDELRPGDRLYVGGLNNWWISTPMVRIEH